MPLELSAGGGLAVSEPDPETIRRSLAGLQGGSDSFAILSRGELTYLQTSGGPDGFVLEYQDGSIDQHYASVQSNLPLATVSEAFLLYASGDAGWRSTTEWEHQGPAASGIAPGILLAVAALLAAFGIWWWLAA